MSHSNRIRVSDLRRIYQLLEETNSLGVDPAAWRQHMLLGLCKLTHARVGITTDVQQALPGHLVQFIEPVAVGFELSELQNFSNFMASDDRLIDPGSIAIMSEHRSQRFVSKPRDEMIDSNDWYTSPVVSEGRRSVNIDHFLVSSVAMNQPGWLHGFALYRNWGEDPFGERDRRIVRLFHAGLLRRLHLSKRSNTANKLPAYLRPMLRSLLQGHSSQQSADSLGLSPHTVKSYTKELYARLGVRSRGEVSAHFYNRGTAPPIFLPAAFDSGY